MTGVGTVVVQASQSGDDDYNPASTEEQSIEISKADQEITFSEIGDQTYGGSPIELSATATSALDVSFEYVSGPASLDGSVLSITGAGSVVILASQSGDDNYNAAELEKTIVVAKADQTITFSSLEDLLMTADPIDLVAEASTGLEVVFSVEGPANLEDDELTLDGIPGTITVTASQVGNENFNSASVQQSFESVYVLSTDIISEHWNVYPNPAKNKLEIINDNDQAAHVEIYHVNGALSLSKKINGQGVVDVQGLQNGIYFLRILEDKAVTTTKILIAR